VKAKRTRGRTTGSIRFHQRLQLVLVLLIILMIAGAAGVVWARSNLVSTKAATSTVTSAWTTAPASTTTRPAPTTTTRPAPTTTTRPALTTTTRPRPKSPLQRHDALPPGVERYMSSFFGGADVARCDELDLPPGPSLIVPDVPEVGELHRICVAHFRPGQMIALAITGPDGSAETHELCFACGDEQGQPAVEWQWGSLPGDATGRYQLTAIQGDLAAAAAFTLDRARLPHLRVVEGGSDQRAQPRGTPMHVALSGFQPRQVIRVLLYRANRRFDQGRYIASVPLATDAHGERLWTLSTSASDPSGFYVLRSQPQVDYRFGMGGITDYIDSFTLA
jgi:hypothetical protein